MFTKMKVAIGMGLIIGLFAQPAISETRCAVKKPLGSASNSFTNILNSTNPVAINQTTKTIIFLHRNNSIALGGNSALLRYDISTDGGKTWTLNKGPINLNTNGTGFLARYPSASIYYTAENSWLAFLAPTLEGTVWAGITNGVEKIAGGDNKDTYTPSPEFSLIQSMCKGARGIRWAIDATGDVEQGGANKIRLWKGTWNSASSNFQWKVQKEIAPNFKASPITGLKVLGGDLRIAFDPTGQYGWVSILSHLNPGPANAAYYPVLYKTRDGGKTWQGPYQLDIGKFNKIAKNIKPGNVASTAFEQSLIVDVKGNPHLFVAVGNGNKDYSVNFTLWHAMYDFTLRDNVWRALEVATVKAGRGSWGDDANKINLDMQPMATRTTDGTKVFFAWTDNAVYALGAPNQTPNFFSKALNVKTNLWTPVRDFTGCNSSINGQILFPKLAPEVFKVPNSTTYMMAAVYSVLTNNDPLQVTNFNFLNNIIWKDSDFTKLN